MTGLLICGPVFSTTPELWALTKEIYGSGDDHIKGDVFRVSVYFLNKSNQPMRNIRGMIRYPDGVVPYPERIYERKITKFPWPGHFIDEERRIVSFNFEHDVHRTSAEFYCFFEAERYGTFHFDYSFEWLGTDSIFYRATPDAQEIILPDSLSHKFSVRSEKPSMAIPEGSTHKTDRPVTGRDFWIGVVLAGIVGILLGILIFGNLIAGKYNIDGMIRHLEKENKKLHKKVERKHRRAGKKS